MFTGSGGFRKAFQNRARFPDLEYFLLLLFVVAFTFTNLLTYMLKILTKPVTMFMFHFISSNQNGLGWKAPKRSSISNPLPWSGPSFSRWGVSELCLTSSWTVPGTEYPQLLWATCPGPHHPNREELHISMLIPKSLVFGCIMNGLRNEKGRRTQSSIFL